MMKSGNTVLITGGASGIGLALARALLARGDIVLACGRSADRLEQARRELPGLQTLVCDIREEEERARLEAWIRQGFWELNVLINNAAVAEPADFAADSHDLQALEVEVAANLVAPIRLVARFLPLLRQRPGATIVNVTSVLAYAPIASLPVHSATKAGLRSFTRSLRRQLRDSTIRVIEVVPPVVDTPMQRGLTVPKLDPDVFAARVVGSIERGEDDVHVGQARVFRLAARIAPETLFRLLNRTVERSTTRAATAGGEVAHARI